MLDDTILDQARQKLTLGPSVPDDEELNARYLGQYDSHAQVARALFIMTNPHIDLAVWPFTHIDWTQAAETLFLGDGGRDLLEVGGHWFDALAAPPVVHA